MSGNPFRDSRRRLKREQDEAFASLMDGEKAVVRLLGPRRTGKTDLVSHFARASKSPILMVTLKPLPADVRQPAPIVADLLAREIASLANTAPKLKATYDALLRKETPRQTKLNVSGELALTPAKLGAAYESSGGPAARASGDADAEICYELRRLELAAEKVGVRPIVFFDEIQELLVRTPDAGMATVWAIRNEAQHHTSCRYVFAGSNQRVFSQLQEGRRAPLLNFGTALVIPPLSQQEIDGWAVPLFRGGKRQVTTLSAATALLCGKIGEVVDLCSWIWSHSVPGDVLADALLREAVMGAAHEQIARAGEMVRVLTRPQTTVLRWILEHPGQPPYGTDGPRATLNAGTIRDALKRLVELDLIEAFSDTRYACTTPLRMFAALNPRAWAGPRT